MQETSAATPQTSSNPLNLLYKGVFSTRIGSNNKSKFGQYLDKLYQIKFLGIGSYDGSVIPGVVDAVMLRITSLDGIEELFKASRDSKQHDAVTLEALGGQVLKKGSSANIAQTKAVKIDRLNPSTKLEDLVGEPNISEMSLYEDLSANQVKFYEQLLDAIAQKVVRQVQLEEHISLNRLDRSHEGEVYDSLEGFSKIQYQGLVERVEEALQRINVEGIVASADTFIRGISELELGEGDFYEIVRRFDLERDVNLKLISDSQATINESSQLTLTREAATDESIQTENTVQIKAEIDWIKSYISRREAELENSIHVKDVTETKAEIEHILAYSLLREAEVGSALDGDKSKVVAEVDWIKSYLLRREAEMDDALQADNAIESRAEVEWVRSYHLLHDFMLEQGAKAEQSNVGGSIATDNTMEDVVQLDAEVNWSNDAYGLIKEFLLERGISAVSSTKGGAIDQGSAAGKTTAGDKLEYSQLFKEWVKERGTVDFGYKSTRPTQEGTQPWLTLSAEKNNAAISYAHDIQTEESKVYKSVLDAIRKGFDDLLYERSDHTAQIDNHIDARSGQPKQGALSLFSLANQEDQGGHLLDSVTGSFAVDARSVSLVQQTLMEEINKRLQMEGDFIQGAPVPITETQVDADQPLGGTPPIISTVLTTEHGEFWNEEAPVVYDPSTEIFGEWVDNKDPIVPTYVTELVVAAMTSPDLPLSVSVQEDLWGEFADSPAPVVSETETELWGSYSGSPETLFPESYVELWGGLDNAPTPLQPDQPLEITGSKVGSDFKFTQYDAENYEIAVLGCSDNRLTLRRRPDLKPDPEPKDPLFEWVCTEGYVCDDWLIVPLKDFNFENPNMDGFYDPITLKPFFPTGQTDANGDPYVLPPYSILNDPLSNGVDAGGKEPMAIDPCNLYSFIEYIVKIYDAYKGRFRASTPIDTMSRVMNMVYDQTLKLIAEWDETKGYGVDELWRIYRFIRWMALGITNRFYRVKLAYTYGDFAEQFEVFPFSDKLTTEGAARKSVATYGNVLEGHPIIDTVRNGARIAFAVPQKTRTSTISFELGNNVPDRPDNILEGGIQFQEKFEGATYAINGTGWVPVQTQGGTSFGVEDPAQAKTYRTTPFKVAANAVSSHIKFNYGFDTNLETVLTLKNTSGAVVWTSAGIAVYSFVDLSVGAGDYYFEVIVPQAEGVTEALLTFTVDRINNEWLKAGELADWEVQGNTIYEVANTGELAMVINQQWKNDSVYSFEGEFMTSGAPTGMEDWLGFIFNYQDENNFYAVGSYGATSPGIGNGDFSGVWKVVGGKRKPYENVTPTWQIQGGTFKWEYNVWYKMKVEVNGNSFKVALGKAGSTMQQVLSVTDTAGWGHGASGLAAYSNPYSTFRNFKYYGKPRFSAYIDNVIVTAEKLTTPVKKPKYLIDFYLEDEVSPRIANYSADGKRQYSFPILVGEHKARWVFKKQGGESSVAQDSSFIDNIVIRGIVADHVEVVEELIGCGGHMAVKLLIENLLEYYRRHHQGCKGERNIWIIE